MSCSASSARAATARARVSPPATRRRVASRATRVPSRRHARVEPGGEVPSATSAARRVLARALDGDEPADAFARALPEPTTDRPPADHPPDAAFDVDDALSAWILLRYVFLWVVFGYVAAPAWAQARGVPTPADLPPVELALVLAAAEVGKLAAVARMLRSELGPDSPAAPWSRERRRVDPPSLARGLAFGILASVAARAVDASLVAVTGSNPTPDDASSDALFAALRAAPYVVVFASAAVAPASEELFFRGYLLPATTRRVPAPFAVALVAALFAALHFNPSETPALFVAGCAFGAAAAGGGGGLAAAIAAHSAYNAGVLAEAALKGGGGG